MRRNVMARPAGLAMALALVLTACGGDESNEEKNGESGKSDEGKENQVEYARYREVVVAYAGARGADPSVERTKEEAARFAAELAQQAKDPARSFPELAWDHSDAQSWTAGGDRGRVSREDAGRVPEALIEALFALEVGEVSEPVELEDGFHVLKRIPKDGDGQGQHLRPYRDLAHIFLEDKAKAQTVMEMAVADPSLWDQLVLQFSRDEETRARGGRLVRYRSSKYGPRFEKAVNQLKPGQIAPEVIPSDRGGWHVLRRLPAGGNE